MPYNTQNPLPTHDLLFLSNGGGEPRSSGYWLIWNSCAEGNQSAVAQSNGGREAGWIILDDLLSNPGILIAENEVTSCQEAVNLLQGKDLQGVSQEDDPAYALAIQLLTAQLNLAAGAESCQAAETAVQAGQLLLLSIGFKGAGNYLASQSTDQDVQTALILTDQLSNYNTGALCR